MSADRGALFVGRVTHRRFAPRAHALRYRMFQVLIDIDAAGALAARMRLFSHNRFNLFAFHDADHGEGEGGDLRPFVERTLERAGVRGAIGDIRLLCMPRILGHVFNPLSVFFCRDTAGALAALIFEVNNTFGDRHFYVLPATGGEAAASGVCGKAFFVSPFMDMGMTYDFKVSQAGERIAVVVRGLERGGRLVIDTVFAGKRRALSDANLARAFITHPLLTLKVVAAIHFEAARLYLKGLKLRPKPKPPADNLTVVSPRLGQGGLAAPL